LGFVSDARGEFLAFCGVLGLGKLIAQGQLDLLPRLRNYASDPHWRTREAVAMALQRWGQVDMANLLQEMASQVEHIGYVCYTISENIHPLSFNLYSY
jgi:hypothetical protein